jgi:cytochrome c biogenesis protein CcmG, thiol:disulfide interchange protein DsbE
MRILSRLIATLLLLHTSLALARVSEGQPAPAFEAKLTTHQSFALENNKGNVVMLHFWATWCSTCLQEMPSINRYYLKHKHQHLRVVTISMDDANADSEVMRFLEPFDFDKTLGRNALYQGYGRIWRLPITFIIDKNGIMRVNGQEQTATLSEETLEKIVTPLLE